MRIIAIRMWVTQIITTDELDELSNNIQYERSSEGHWARRYHDDSVSIADTEEEKVMEQALTEWKMGR